jgi:Domain of unknown function (DUF1707)
MRRQASLRAADTDRDAVVERLREAAGEGRLESEELEQRVEAALRARTYGELAWRVADLPGPARRRSFAETTLRATVLMTALVVALVAIAAIAAIVLLVVAIVALAATGWVAFVLLWFLLCGARRRRARAYRRASWA